MLLLERIQVILCILVYIYKARIPFGILFRVYDSVSRVLIEVFQYPKAFEPSIKYMSAVGE
jgi:hypothetical protein